MFCYSAAESTVAGTPMIASALDALTERIKHNRTGYLIDGDINSVAVQDKFVHTAIALLEDATLRNKLGSAAQNEVGQYDSDTVAARWEQLAGRKP